MNRQDFDKVYREYLSDVFLYLRSISRDPELAEELTQQFFFKALRSLEKFRGDCDIRVWLCQIAKNEFLTYCRKNKRSKGIMEELSESEDIQETISDGGGFNKKIEDSIDAIEIVKILHSLPEPYKEVFSLRTFGELSFRQIGEVFGCSESWARVTYHRARLKIIQKYGGNDK